MGQAPTPDIAGEPPSLQARFVLAKPDREQQALYGRLVKVIALVFFCRDAVRVSQDQDDRFLHHRA